MNKLGEKLVGKESVYYLGQNKILLWSKRALVRIKFCWKQKHIICTVAFTSIFEDLAVPPVIWTLREDDESMKFATSTITTDHNRSDLGFKRINEPSKFMNAETWAGNKL